MKIPFNLFVTATISCQQLIVAVKADENENQRRDLKFGTHFKFIVYTKNPVIFLLSAVNS